MGDAAEYIALFEFGEIEPGAEMLAVAGKHHDADIVRQGIKERHQALHQRVVQSVALLGAMQVHYGDGTAPLGAKRRRQYFSKLSCGVNRGVVL
jgi:hypothetical protein